MVDAYHKARRQFTLFSGILIIWEYIGVHVGKEVKLNGVDVMATIDHPEIIPFVIFLLVLYFALRFTIEWQQCPKPQRHQNAMVADVVVTYLVGLAATIVYSLQKLSTFRLTESLSLVSVLVMVAGSMVGAYTLLMWNFTNIMRDQVDPSQPLFRRPYMLGTAGIIVLWLIMTTIFSIPAGVFFAGVAGVLVIPVLVTLMRISSKLINR